MVRKRTGIMRINDDLRIWVSKFEQVALGEKQASSFCQPNETKFESGEGLRRLMGLFSLTLRTEGTHTHTNTYKEKSEMV